MPAGGVNPEELPHLTFGMAALIKACDVLDVTLWIWIMRVPVWYVRYSPPKKPERGNDMVALQCL